MGVSDLFYPKLWDTFQHYSKDQFISDVIAGVIVGIVAIPLAIAFAIASGVSPDKGFVTAIVAGFLISALGGSRVQIGGPTGAFVVIVYGIVQKYGVDGLVLATFMAGIILVIMGVARFGVIIKFVPRSVIVGFTSGIAVVIFSSQIRDLFGLDIQTIPADFIAKWQILSGKLGSFNPYALFLSCLTIAIIALWPKFLRKIPGSVAALLLTSWLATYAKMPVDTIGSRFGDLPHTLPIPHLSWFDLGTLQHLFQPAFTIALLGAIESLLSAVVADGMIGGKHRSNTELIAQGVANIGSAIFGGMPATGAIARTVTNVKNGGRTPVAGIVHALTLMIAMLFLADWIRHIPMACLAGILVVVSYHMSEWRSFRELMGSGKNAIIVLLGTFFVTILIDLTVAIELGMVLSAFLFVKRMSDVECIKLVREEMQGENTVRDEPFYKYKIPSGVELYVVSGPLFFGAASQFDETDRIVNKKPKVRILIFQNVSMIDSTGLHALKQYNEKCKRSHIHLLLAGVHAQPLDEAIKDKLSEMMGEEHVFQGAEEALAKAVELIKVQNPTA